MTYRVVMNSALYHCGYKWLVVDESWNIISKHATQQAAELEAERLNAE